MKSGIHAQGQSSHLGHSQGGGGGGGGSNGSEVCCLRVKRSCLLVWSGTIWWTFFSFDASGVENVGMVSLQKRNFSMELSRQESLSFMESLGPGVFLSFALVAIV